MWYELLLPAFLPLVSDSPWSSTYMYVFEHMCLREISPESYTFSFYIYSIAYVFSGDSDMKDSLGKMIHTVD